MVMVGKSEMLCTGSEGCIPYEVPSPTSASEPSPQCICIKASVWWEGARNHPDDNVLCLVQRVGEASENSPDEDQEVNDMWASHQFDVLFEYHYDTVEFPSNRIDLMFRKKVKFKFIAIV
jgi:hypothetical protein